MASNSAFASLFNEEDFRTNIRATMQMGMPEDDTEKLTWCWKRDRVYVPGDRTASPYAWDDAPAANDPGNPTLPDEGDDQELVVDYALEFSSRPAGSDTTVMGEIDTSRAVVTLFDVDWEQVQTADYCRINDAKYRIQFAGPPLGMFAVTVYQVYLEAWDEA